MDRLRKVKHLALDLDGTLYLGGRLFPFTLEFLARVKEMGFKPVAVEWTTAWDLTIRSNAPSGAEKLLKELFHALDDK